MELNFDVRGNLKLYEIIELSMEDFKNIFVNSFAEDSRRHELFEKYLIYLDNFREVIRGDFFQWINGSFVTTKYDPKDIDLVSVIHYQDYEKNIEELRKRLTSSNARRLFEVDAYIVADYPESHKKYSFTKSDLVYWRNLFGQTKANRARKKYPKRFIQINFIADE